MQVREPDLQTIYYEGGFAALNSREGCRVNDVKLAYLPDAGGNTLKIAITAQRTGLKFLRLRWNFSAGELPPAPRKVLGDEWERGYGAMEWRGLFPERCMPWYFFISGSAGPGTGTAPTRVSAYGVMTRPRAFCFWQSDEAGVTFWADVRNGGKGVLLNGRTLQVATIVFREFEGISAFEAAEKFCRVMSPDPILPRAPVYGSNNWYYAYGNSSHGEILKDARLLAGLTGGLENRPFLVMDDGWQPNRCDGPWRRGNEKFPDMPGLAGEILEKGVRPGIWVRLLADFTRSETGLPEECRMQRDRGVLDPSHPGVIEHVKEDVRRLAGWGYQLIKHDFSSRDIVGEYGFARKEFIVPPAEDWCFYDRSRTTAEIVTAFYAAVGSGAGGALILGCNCFSHLCAGLAHLNRTGDDTSGIAWERTRRMGVNTLAFRMMQNRSFYASDADCVGITEKIPWELNRQWLYAVAHSGSPLFVSVKPGTLRPEQAGELESAFLAASAQKDRLLPLDWMDNVCPSSWLLNGKPVKFRWFAEEGSNHLLTENR